MTDDSAGRLFRQRETVDALRSYLDLTDKLISDMRANRLLSANDVEVVTTLPSPSNRHELLQLLIRKRWSAAMLDTFCSVLRRSSSLNRSLADRLQHPTVSHVNDSWSTERSNEEMEPHDVDLSSSLDSLLEPLPVEDRCTIQVMVRKKDQCIDRVTRQKDHLQNDLQRCKKELEDARIKMQLSERQLNDWLAGMHLSTTAESLPEALEDVKSKITSQTDRIWQLETKNLELKDTCIDLKDTLKAELADKAMLEKKLDEAKETIAMDQRERESLERQIAGVRDEMIKTQESSVRSEGQGSVDENSANDTGKPKPAKVGGKHHQRHHHHHHLQTSRSVDSAKHADPAAKNSKQVPAQKLKRRISDTTPPWRAGLPNTKTTTTTSTAAATNTPRRLQRRSSVTGLPSSMSWKNHADE